MLIQGILIAGILILLHPHVERAGGGLLGQGQELRHINVYADVVHITAAFWLCGVIGHKLQVYFVKMEGVVSDLHKAPLGILTDDLTPVVLRYRLVVVFHSNHTFAGSRSLAAASAPSVSGRWSIIISRNFRHRFRRYSSAFSNCGMKSSFVS